ncbi:aspartate/glutamate racemase family protein [Salinicola peritrichatus]|uniref:aspartate/glutamate racemase family protein n=1 Tax=Salinicola peritrichatus TaxID=1267424 RepID=UPI0013A629CD|nr:aspartate/glutamate racemase family protein [Salinicola peritrichatus]
MFQRSRVLYGGHNLYGHAVGILMIEGHFPRPVGAIGNAATFDFPVMHHVVRGFTGSRMVRELGTMDPESHAFHDAIAPWIDGARLLVDQGCRAITTSCGFAILLQKPLAAAIDVPVLASSLLLAPMLTTGLGEHRRLGIITAEASSLTDAHLAAAGLDRGRVAIIGMEGAPEFAATAWHDRPALDLDAAESETIAIAQRLMAKAPDIGALLLECSLLPPYATAIQREIDIPIFDFTHLVRMLHDAAQRHEFPQ